MIAGLVLQFVTFGILQSFAVSVVGQLALWLAAMVAFKRRLQMILASVQQAAQAAADAAVALREASQNRSGGFAEANKTVQAPKEFGSTTSSEDQNNWADFAFSFISSGFALLTQVTAQI